MAKFDSKAYWEARYKNNLTSGNGSYGVLGDFKAKVVNGFISEKNVATIKDLGVGDGNQLGLLRGFKHYIGYDVSPTVIQKCKTRFKLPRYEFHLYPEAISIEADMSISMDVLYHLVEDDVYLEYLDNLFMTKYVIIYGMDFDGGDFAPHVRPRKFTTTIAQRYPQYNLIKKVPQMYRNFDHHKGSLADFFIYEVKPL